MSSSSLVSLSSVISVLTSLAITALMIAGMWKVFTKAGEAGWKAIIPIYNSMTLFKIIYGSMGKFFLTFIPGFGAVVEIFALVRLGQVYGKSVGFRVGLVFLSPIFLLILGFGDSTYDKPVDSFI